MKKTNILSLRRKKGDENIALPIRKEQKMKKLKHVTTTLLCAVFFSAALTVSSFAATADDIAESRAEAEAAADGRHFELRNGTWYAKDKENRDVSGWTYDENGELYYAKADGSLIISGMKGALEFDENGVFTPSGIWAKEKYEEKCMNLEEGKTIEAGANENEMKRFFSYYIRQYRFWENETNINLELRNGKWITKLEDFMRYDREAIVNAVINKFGIPEGNNSSEIMYDTCRRVTEHIEYEPAYMDCNAMACLNNNRGVCWFLAKCVKVVAEKRDIQVETMVGNYLGTPHMWLRYRDGEKWCYCDPTNVALYGSLEWCNIPYEKFISDYEVMDYVYLN